MSAIDRIDTNDSDVHVVKYVPSPTMIKFHEDDKFVRALIGPIGSGKSVACVMEMLRKSFSQKPNHEGIRKTRWVVVRNTYRELNDTTMQTFFDWFPEKLGKLLKKDMKFFVKLPHPDNETIAEIEFLFRALDKPDDIKKLLSLEVTGGWLNEVREIPKAILDMLIGRLGRYPSMRDGGPSWHGLIMDTNPPDSDHWFYKLFEEDIPENHAVFHQPSGTSPEAENINNLPPLYYENIMAGKDQEWINVYVHGLYGFVLDGKPVYPEYHDDIHHTDEKYTVNPKLPIYIGLDFGLTPAATFGQKTATGQWVIFDELVTEDMGAVRFSSLLNAHINEHYRGMDLQIYGDPAGDFRSQTDEKTPFDILDAAGIVAWPAHTNDFIIRRESVVSPLTRMDYSGNPGFVITPGAPMLRKAMAGGYKYKRVAVSGQERWQDKPDKGRYSHVAESLQYLMLGAGEDQSVVGGYGKATIDYSQTNRMVI